MDRDLRRLLDAWRRSRLAEAEARDGIATYMEGHPDRAEVLQDLLSDEDLSALTGAALAAVNELQRSGALAGMSLADMKKLTSRRLAVASIGPKRPDGTYSARYRDAGGKEHARHFTRKVDAQRWLDEQTAALVTGTHVSPRTARTTVEQWCATWLEGYATRRAGTVRQARVHIRQIVRRSGRCGWATFDRRR